MQPHYLLTVILAITEFAPTNLVAGRPALSNSQGTTTQHLQLQIHSPAAALPAAHPSADVLQVVRTCAYKLGSTNLKSLLSALTDAGKDLNLQPGDIYGDHVSIVLRLTELMVGERRKIVLAIPKINRFLSKTPTADSQRLGIWPSSSVALMHDSDDLTPINKIHRFVQLGELLGWGDVRSIVSELDSLRYKTVGEKMINEIVEPMVEAAHEMLDTQIHLVAAVHEVRVTLNLRPVEMSNGRGSLAGTIASSRISSRSGSSV